MKATAYSEAEMLPVYPCDDQKHEGLLDVQNGSDLQLLDTRHSYSFRLEDTAKGKDKKCTPQLS